MPSGTSKSQDFSEWEEKVCSSGFREGDTPEVVKNNVSTAFSFLTQLGLKPTDVEKIDVGEVDKRGEGKRLCAVVAGTKDRFLRVFVWRRAGEKGVSLSVHLNPPAAKRLHKKKVFRTAARMGPIEKGALKPTLRHRQIQCGCSA